MTTKKISKEEQDRLMKIIEASKNDYNDVPSIEFDEMPDDFEVKPGIDGIKDLEKTINDALNGFEEKITVPAIRIVLSVKGNKTTYLFAKPEKDINDNIKAGTYYLVNNLPLFGMYIARLNDREKQDMDLQAKISVDFKYMRENSQFYSAIFNTMIKQAADKTAE